MNRPPYRCIWDAGKQTGRQEVFPGMTALPVVVGLSSSIVFVVLLVKLLQRNRALHTENTFASGLPQASSQVWSEEWFAEFSSFRYLPMRRLLSEDEEEYWMQSTAGSRFQREEFRAERRRLFREYLRLISADFACLSQGVRLSVVHAAEDRSEEISQLLSLEWSLRKLLWKAQIGLMFHWLGVKPVDATQLINALQGFEFSLREIRLNGAAA